MHTTLTTHAIQCALTQNWKEAIATNQELLKADQENVETLNRLAFAYLKTGHLKAAQTHYKKVLKIDKYNPIALKNLQWLGNLTKSDIHTDQKISASPTIFLEEPGKTKIVSLVDLSPARVLCNFMTAQKVTLIAKKHSIEVRDAKCIYIGALPDDLAHRLLRFIGAGNSYDVYIKNVEKNSVSVFIRERKRGRRFSQIPSFQIVSSNGYAPRALKRSENVQEVSEEEE